jgi:hypothetical protein
MAKRRRPWWGAGPYENFRQNVVQRFMNFDRDAQNHVVGRNQSVAQVLGYLNLLFNAGLIPEGSQIVPGGARWQSLGGSRPNGTEGAHCLPCQILVIPPDASKGIDPSDLPGLGPAVRQGIRTEFAHVTSLPVLFNSADVIAEQCRPAGLREAFAGAVQEVIRGRRRPKENRLFRGPNDLGAGEFRDVWLIDRDAVRRAYWSAWVPRAEMGYEAALDEVENNQLARYLGPLRRTAEPALIMEVLNAYLKHHRAQEPSKLRDAQMDELERAFNG